MKNIIPILKSNILLVILYIGLFFVSTGASYAIFSSSAAGGDGTLLSPNSKISPSKRAHFKVDPKIPRDQVCPLDGMKYTKKEKDVWEKRRPLAVMVENSEDARPQSSLSRADIIYEALAEGWITRFMAVFYCNTPFENMPIAPVRSARTYFIDWVSEYDGLYTHVGGANTLGDNADKTDPRADALGQIDRYGIKDMDEFGISFPDCYRNPDRLDHPVATEHQMVCFSENLYKIAEKRNWTNVDEEGEPWDKNFTPWKFKEDASKGDLGDVKTINITFSPGYEKYSVKWQFDKESDSYKRFTGGVPHLDREDNEQLLVKNVVVQLTKLLGPVDDNGHFLYTTIGSGKAVIFQDGKAIVGTWNKPSRTARTKFFSQDGSEIEFNRGPIWVEVLQDSNYLTY
ncbi:hypothetical protein A2773_04515 [Candidatus Gottesmanbacteria bacterium RIFCSPHIGHO2_01_FULL_39_10]|uniref:DUF3048 domain-containing protein n=1 Tax=Candidatus Gottesmanbacteria bacterium RIFCSPHIGHO2_01_FULL_39_10 TaxID=1798375 RepID=A0A1F5ZS11_9BACT|nr:MAG: hypothetical protein A2773_04515 [Candidatus Gottesmanbacteria bacterium RIFCSPHIGHO2_01_FULL_39_10]